MYVRFSTRATSLGSLRNKKLLGRFVLDSLVAIPLVDHQPHQSIVFGLEPSTHSTRSG